MWTDTALTRRLKLRYPIVQGPFGGGLSSPELAAIVSNAGGLGSYGAHGLPPSRIVEVIGDIRARTAAPFAVNLWVSNEDALAVSAEAYAAAVAPLRPLFAELGIAPPDQTAKRWPSFEQQIDAIFEARPPILSFIFGIPPADVIERCLSLGIALMGTATTVDEAVAIEASGADVVVASGFEAGGHRASFLRPAEVSLTGTLALVPQVADSVKIPVVAAGGIGDGRGIVAALTLGASGVQIGTAFLACDESNATAAHRDALHSARAHHTILTRRFTGRLARGLPNRVSEAAGEGPHLPYPLQGHLVSALREEAIRQGRHDLVTFWSGQSARLVRDRDAAALFARLVAETSGRLDRPDRPA